MGSKATGSTRDRYLVKSVVHSSRLLSAFRTSGEALPLREISLRSGLPKSMAFRLLYTLERCGMVEKVGENLYRSCLRPFKQKLYRLGYAAQGTDYQFSKEVSAGLQRAAQAEGIELICVDNRYNAKIALRNADVLVREKVDLVIEFQTDEHVAPIVAAKYREANIPLIAIEVPHPGATYFGANNYEAGLIGGRFLGRWAKQHWHGEVDEIVFMALARAGSLPRMRLTGMLVGLKEIIPRWRTAASRSSTATVCSATASRSCGSTCGRTDRGVSSSARSTTRARSARSAPFRKPDAQRRARSWAERFPRGPLRAAPRRNAPRRLGRVFPRKIRRSDCRRRARYPAPSSDPARCLRQARARDARKRQSRLPERRADGGGAGGRGVDLTRIKSGHRAHGDVTEGTKGAKPLETGTSEDWMSHGRLRTL